MAAGLRVGLKGYLYYNAGTYNSPSWTAISIVNDKVMLGLEKTMAAFVCRGSTFEENLPLIKKAPLSWKMLSDTSDSVHDVLRDMFINDTVADLAFADDAIATSGTRYWRADYYLSKFPMDQPLDQANNVEVEAVLARSSNSRSFTTVGS